MNWKENLKKIVGLVLGRGSDVKIEKVNREKNHTQNVKIKGNNSGTIVNGDNNKVGSTIRCFSGSPENNEEVELWFEEVE